VADLIPGFQPTQPSRNTQGRKLEAKGDVVQVEGVETNIECVPGKRNYNGFSGEDKSAPKTEDGEDLINATSEEYLGQASTNTPVMSLER